MRMGGKVAAGTLERSFSRKWVSILSIQLGYCKIKFTYRRDRSLQVDDFRFSGFGCHE